MYELIQKIISVLTTDAILNAIVPASQIFVGPVDIVTEKQAELLIPQVNVHVISEVIRSVPSNTRDTLIQIDIWSRNSQIEVVGIYERIIVLLNYMIADQSTAHIFWEVFSGAVDQYESDRRIFHRSITIKSWTQK